jgi:poly-gamma-glutamate capsule biosynthesis protein CapA/YwtB (metallophosphatase superfamily)
MGSTTSCRAVTQRWGLRGLVIAALSAGLTAVAWDGSVAVAAPREIVGSSTIYFEGPRAAEPVRLSFVGDVIFGRYTDDGYERRPRDASRAFDGVREALQGAFTLANLETPVVDVLPTTRPLPSPLLFGAEPWMVEYLVNAGVTAVTVANNHAADQGISGLNSTPPLLRGLGLDVVGGAGKPISVQSLDVGQLRLGVIALTTLLNFELPPRYPQVPFAPLSEVTARLAPSINGARANHDLLIVAVHWGNEYDAVPNPKQRKVASELLARGVDLLVGHHPHVLQPIEITPEGAVAYSLGNFFFDAAQPDSRLGGILTWDVARHACKSTLTFTPTQITLYPQRVELATGAAARRARSRVRRGTNVQWTSNGEKIHLDVPLRSCRAVRDANATDSGGREP